MQRAGFSLGHLEGLCALGGLHKRDFNFSFSQTQKREIMQRPLKITLTEFSKDWGLGNTSRDCPRFALFAVAEQATRPKQQSGKTSISGESQKGQPTRRHRGGASRGANRCCPQGGALSCLGVWVRSVAKGKAQREKKTMPRAIDLGILHLSLCAPHFTISVGGIAYSFSLQI